MTTAGTVTAAQIAQEVKNQGGSEQQAWVAAALASGIESNGELADKNPSSTACGLFQFLTTTWESNGGTQYAPTACDASLSQQVAIFLKASAGGNFYPWAPDLGGSYNGKPISSALPNSPVANKIAELAASGVLSNILGNVPPSLVGGDGGILNASPTPIPGVGGDGGSGVAGSAQTGTGIPNPISGVDSFFTALGSGFGLGWTGIFTIVLGALLIIVGLVFIFRKQAVKIGEAAAMSGG